MKFFFVNVIFCGVFMGFGFSCKGSDILGEYDFFCGLSSYCSFCVFFWISSDDVMDVLKVMLGCNGDICV